MPTRKAIMTRQKISNASQDKSMSRSRSKSQAKTTHRGRPKKEEPVESEESQPSEVSEQEQTDDQEVVYEKGTYLAIVDPSAEDQYQFKIALVKEDFTSSQESIVCNIFKEGKTTMEFTLQSQDQTVLDYTVICEAKVTVLKSTGKKNPVVKEVKITKTVQNKVKKLIDTVIQAIKDNADDSEEEEESESEKEEVALTQPVKRVLRIKGVKMAPPASQVPPQTRDKRNKKAVNQDEEMKPDEKAKPQIGRKRRLQESSVEDEDYEEEEVPRKQRKVDSDMGETIEKIKAQRPKKPKKMPTVYKRNVWNPNIEIVKEEEEKDHKSNDVYKWCCIRCNNRNVMRAVLTGNKKLLVNCIHDTKGISNLNQAWGPDDATTPLNVIIKDNKLDLLEEVLMPKVAQGKGEQYSDARRRLMITDRAQPPVYLLNQIQQGTVSRHAYGAQIRAVEMTRGNRQGNNAFLQEQYSENDDILNMNQTDLNVETMEIMIKSAGGANRVNEYYDPIASLSYQIHEYVLNGKYKEVAFILSKIWNQSNYGFNELHYNVVRDYKPNELLKEFKSVSVQKKGTSCMQMTPLHFACINPNSSVLEQLLKVNGDLAMMDMNMRKPIHFAAVCETPDNLKLLIQKGAAIGDIDRQKTTCMHLAAKAGRAENLKYLISVNKDVAVLKDRSGKSPFAYALEFNHTECVKILFETGLFKINQGLGPNRMQPLSFAAVRGNFELCKWLIEHKARIVSADKFKRCPLVMAVRNGHLKVASLLLKHGADWNQADSSGNTPLHFASAYGQRCCMKLLLDAGADINAENSWRVTPINIAMLKNHQGCVKFLLEYPQVDVNCKDEKGRTLLTMALLDLTEQTVEFVKYLLDKGANPNLLDIEGQNALHYLAQTSTDVHQHNLWRFNQEEQEKIREESRKLKIKIQLELADILLAKGADLTQKDNEQRTPFAICLDKENSDLLSKLMSKISLNKQSELLHSFSSKILFTKYQEILAKLMENDKPTKETMNVLNHMGLSPFLAYIEQFATQFPTLRSTMLQLVNFEAAKHKDQVMKYEITNLILFEKSRDGFAHQSTNNFGGFGGPRRVAARAARKTTANFGSTFEEEDVLQDSVSIERRQEIADELMDKLVAQPFVQLMEVLIKNGCDQHMQVQKLDKFRDLEEERRLLCLANKLPFVPKEKEVEEKGMKREEVLDKRVKAKKAAMQGKVKIKVAQEEKKKEKKESEYHDTMGLQNAYHLIISYPHKRLLKFLEGAKVYVDTPDHKGMTPFNLLSTKSLDSFQILNRECFEFLIRQGSNIDHADNKHRTAFLNFVSNNNQSDAFHMLELGAHINQMDKSGLFALKYALIRRDSVLIQSLIDKGANINQIDNKGRNLLHHAVNMSSASADATFETENQLIELGIDVNLKDRHNRTPLHYAFVKIKNWKDNSAIDPIETVSSLCGVPGLEMDVADKWKKTPLHYAAQRGASICQLYLFKRAVNKEAIDIYGNTPLGVALLNKHHNSAIIMIQKQVNVKALVYGEDPDRIAKMWKQEGKVSSRDEDQIMHEDQSEEEEDQANKKHRKLFEKKKRANDYYDYDDEDEYEEEEEDSDDQFEMNAFNKNNAFNQQVFNPKQKQGLNFSNAPTGLFNFGINNQFYNQGEENKEEETIKVPLTMFRIAIRDKQLGLAYSMIDEGYNLMQAMQDAMDENKFQLCLTLLQKYPDEKIVQQKNSKQQNLFHILCQNSGGQNIEHLKRIYVLLKKRGVNCLERDGEGRTALHYAVISQSKQLVQMLIDEGADPNQVDGQGKSPLVLLLQGKKCRESCLFNPSDGKYDPLFELLAKSGANMNQLYAEQSFKPEQGTGPYKCTLLINFIRQLSDVSFQDSMYLRGGLLGLIHFGATVDVLDSDRRDAMIYAVTSNRTDLVQYLINNKSKLKMIQDQADVYGKTALHYVVTPCRFGSFENTEILTNLSKAGYSLEARDGSGLKPIDYAAQQKSGKMLKQIYELLGRANFSKKKQAYTFTKASDWPDPEVDFDQDSHFMMEAAKAREEKRLKEMAQKEEHLVPVDETGKFEKSYKVFCEGLKPWDCYLTKVDLKNGVYGDYVFYKMQMLYDSVRDLYVVFTRYGRIGESGMNQRTPFTKVEEAKKEFCSIFKSKTGNDFNDLENFTRVKKKYNIARVHYVTTKHQDYLAPFDLEKCPKSKLEKNTRNLLEEIGNVTMYQRAMNQLGYDQSILPISGIKKEVIKEAMGYLNDLQTVIEEDVEESKKGFKADLDKIQEIRDRIQELSSKYYELIPQKKFVDQIPQPISNQNLIKAEYNNLNTLIDIEKASRILLAALYRQQEIHPADYLYKALNAKMEYLDPASGEYEAILNYIKQGNQGSVNFATHKINMFKIERKGEAENFADFAHLHNQRLLFHGSSLFNFVGLLSQGMRIAPPEAPVTGYMFGKGLYFADMFSKSYQYSHGRGIVSQDSSVLILCDVALGKMKRLYLPENVEKLETQFQSVHGVGTRGPDYKHSLIHPDGVEIPSGPVIDYELDKYQKEQQKKGLGFQALAHNEFVTYNSSQVKMRYLLQVVKKSKQELERDSK